MVNVKLIIVRDLAGDSPGTPGVPCPPLIKNKFLVVSQKRIPINKITYEFPGGIIDKGSNPINSAKTLLKIVFFIS